MERHFAHIAKYREQRGEKPDIERRVRMPTHVHHVAEKNITSVVRMQRLNLRVLRAVKIIDIVALNRLVEKRQAQRQHQQDDQRDLRPNRSYSGFQRRTGLRAAATSSTRDVRVL